MVVDVFARDKQRTGSTTMSEGDDIADLSRTVTNPGVACRLGTNGGGWGAGRVQIGCSGGIDGEWMGYKREYDGDRWGTNGKLTGTDRI